MLIKSKEGQSNDVMEVISLPLWECLETIVNAESFEYVTNYYSLYRGQYVFKQQRNIWNDMITNLSGFEFQ